MSFSILSSFLLYVIFKYIFLFLICLLHFFLYDLRFCCQVLTIFNILFFFFYNICHILRHSVWLLSYKLCFPKCLNEKTDYFVNLRWNELYSTGERARYLFYYFVLIIIINMHPLLFLSLDKFGKFSAKRKMQEKFIS